MTYLGDLGTTPRPANDFTFGYFGSVLRVHPDLTPVAVVDLFGAMGDAEKANDGDRAIAALRSIGSTLVHPDDVDDFWRLARENRQTMGDLAELATKMMAALTDRPTSRPSDSADGPSRTPGISGEGSSLPALRLLEGRPDLQVAVLQAEEARSA